MTRQETIEGGNEQKDIKLSDEKVKILLGILFMEEARFSVDEMCSYMGVLVQDNGAGVLDEAMNEIYMPVNQV